MAIKTETVGDVVIVRAKGKMMGGKETEECHLTVKDLIAQDYKNVVIDMSKVKWVNSRGLGMLIACFTSLRNVNGDLRIAGATEKTRSLLMMTKLITVFENFETVNEAVASYK